MPTNLLRRATRAKQITATIISTKAAPPEAAAINVNGSFPRFPTEKNNKINKMKPRYIKIFAWLILLLGKKNHKILWL